ncbi:60S acidic ribosomal protein P2-like [Schistocerca nitens]|uniref:60S acidic ribosomal protein P2-like n=1 Tax=Schistocerca nitens TaxID=7011 RepID=UPI002117733F|nr:60S acidic ribosomal protein P2-like [Schistocerca nitens]
MFGGEPSRESAVVWREAPQSACRFRGRDARGDQPALRVSDWEFRAAAGYSWAQSAARYFVNNKENPTSADIEKILSSVGIEADSERLTKVISELNGKNIESLIAAGREKLASMPVGGAAALAAAAAAGGGGAAAAAAPEKEEKKPEKKEESSESDDDDMGFGLFD